MELTVIWWIPIFGWILSFRSVHSKYLRIRGLGLCILRACLRDSNVHSGLWTTGVIQWWFFSLLVSLTRSSNLPLLCPLLPYPHRVEVIQCFNSLAHRLSLTCITKGCLSWYPCSPASPGKLFSPYLQNILFPSA